MGIRRLQVEPVDLVDIDGGRISAVGEFKYLETLMANQGGATSDISHRLQATSVAYSHLKPIWNSRALSFKLKIQLFSAVIASILLYNSECWTITHDDLCRLKSFCFRCLRHLTRPTRCSGQPANFVDKVSKQTVFDVAKVPTITSLLRERRLRWLGHLLRADPRDTAHQYLLHEAESNSSWWKLLKEDFETVHIRSFAEAKRLADVRVVCGH